jgi:ribonuclease BN (tRNA processing enzyme)
LVTVDDIDSDTQGGLMQRTLNGAGSWTRRDWLKVAAALPWALPAFAQAQGGQARGGQRGQATAKPGTELVLLGTQGGPGVTANRTQASNAVIIDGRPYLVDFGYGALKSCVQAGITLGNISNVFITHLHDDHTADIAALIALKWTASANPGEATIHGPYGTTAMVEAAIAFSKANVEIRKIDEGRTVDPKTIFHGRDLDAPKITTVFKDDRLTVQAVENTHFPERAKAKMDYRSFAYRFNTATRSIVFSGDTAYSENLIELARDADVFVCEILGTATNQNANNNQNANTRGAAQTNNTANNNTNTNGESIGRHVRETHSTPEDVGKMASAAKVKTLVLSHQVGGGRGGNNDGFTAPIKKVFSGQIIVGADQMRL